MSREIAMGLPDLLAERRAEALARWRALVLEGTLPAGITARTPGQDPFHDPIGVSLWRATAAVYDRLCGPRPAAGAVEGLEELVRIRSVQELGAAEAVRFVFLVRTALREVLGEALERAPREERIALDDRVDAIALQAFDAYVRSREKLFDLRAREAVSRSSLLLERARRLIEEREAAPPSAAEGGAS